MTPTLSALLITITTLGGALGETTPDQEPSVECDITHTICAYAIVYTDIDCTYTATAATCNGTAVIGGAAYTPTRLPGTMTWSGQIDCADACPYDDVTDGGTTTWPVNLMGGVIEATRVEFEPVTIERPENGCTTYTLTAASEVRAVWYQGLTEASSGGSTTSSASVCAPA